MKEARDAKDLSCDFLEGFDNRLIATDVPLVKIGARNRPCLLEARLMSQAR